jgi:hypothetical protein
MILTGTSIVISFRQRFERSQGVRFLSDTGELMSCMIALNDFPLPNSITTVCV